MKTLFEDIIWAFKLWSLTSVIPLSLSLMNILIGGILGMTTKWGFWMTFKIIWIGYYFTGSLMNIEAWRWHLGILLLAFIFVKLDKTP